MLLPRTIRKLLGVFRGSVAPPIIFLSVLIGFCLGLMPGFSGLHIVLIAAVLLLNIHIRLFMLSLVFGGIVSLSAAPLLYYTGMWIHNHFSGLLFILSSVPVAGMTDFSRYAMAGAVVIGPIIGAACGLTLAFIVINFRKMMLKIDSKSETFRKWYSKTWVRILDRILIGKRTRDVKELFDKPKYIRKIGIVLSVLVTTGFLVVANFLQGTTVRDYVVRSLTRTNGAEVNLESFILSVLGGSISASDLQVTDPKQPDRNQLAAEKIEAQASVYGLLLGRLVMENVEVSAVKFDQPRQSPGMVMETPTKEEVPFDPKDYEVTKENTKKLEKYVKDAKRLKEWLEKLRQWLPEGKEEKATKPEQPPHKYLEYLQVKASVPPAPKVLVRHMLADKVDIPSEFFGNSRVLATNFSDAPYAAGKLVTLDIKSHETPAAISILADYSSSSTPVISGTFEGFDLSKVQRSLGQETGLELQSGTASGNFTGQITRKQIDLTVNLHLKDLEAKGAGKGILGIGAGQTSEVMDILKELNITIRIVGPTSEPRLVFDSKRLSEELGNALIRAGEDRLQKEIENRLQKQIAGKLGEKGNDELREAIKKPATSIVEGLESLLKGRKEKKDLSPK
ncbi:MAG: hypothetical protein E3K32_10865 [wastewater metagenome]|nr:hypothetical protein [Candidatus Loosdrechtia aerotolerans]